MPFDCPIDFRELSDSEFTEIDRSVMRCAFDCHNDMGRLCDEPNYECDLAARLADCRFSRVMTQVPIAVYYGSFKKIYRLDLVVGQMIYELKTVETLSPSHEAQCIHYSILAGISRTKLINFRSTKVKGLLKRTSQFALSLESDPADLNRWETRSEKCKLLLDYLNGLIEDVGPSLTKSLYADAATHFCGGELRCIRNVPLRRGHLDLGKQKYRCHADDVAFMVTTVSSEIARFELDLRKRLRMTNLRALQWFNLTGGRLNAVTIDVS